jgi:hypothetical protein
MIKLSRKLNNKLLCNVNNKYGNKNKQDKEKKDKSNKKQKNGHNNTNNY